MENSINFLTLDEKHCAFEYNKKIFHLISILGKVSIHLMEDDTLNLIGEADTFLEALLEIFNLY